MGQRALAIALGVWALLTACSGEGEQGQPAEAGTAPDTASDASSPDAAATPQITDDDASTPEPTAQADAGGDDASTRSPEGPGPMLVSVSAVTDIDCDHACADLGQTCSNACVDGTRRDVAGVSLYPMRVGTEVFDVPSYLDGCGDVSLSFDRSLRIGLECCCEAPCQSDAECASGLCDLRDNACVECVQHADCEAAAYCNERACEPDVCQAGDSRCVGNAVSRCDADGAGFDVGLPCSEGQNCVEAQQRAQCVDWECSPGAIGCDGNDLVACAADGVTELSRQSCADAGGVCVQGACMTPICEPGTQTCENGDVFECDSTGTERTRITACSSSEYCAEDGGTASCMPQVCEPDASTCEGEVLSTCNADGSAIASTTDCAANNQWCLYGRCRRGSLYSEHFTAGATSQAQCDVWNDFRKELDTIFGVLQVRSSAGGVALECRGSVASAICQGIGYGVPVGPSSCGGNTYEVSTGCGTLNAVELFINQPRCTCTPDSTSLAIRPCNGGTDWGGVSCNPVSQTLEVLCTL